MCATRRCRLGALAGLWSRAARFQRGRLMSCRRFLPGLCLVLMALGSASAQDPSGQSKLVPPGWTVEPAQGSKSVIRYVSPDRTAMLTLGDEARDGRSVAAAFAAGTHRGGDRITYARKARSWIELS